ncbi:hypothetical protein ACIBG5_37230 [Kribbella sp. NPDC050241]|uniref:hypothetical protein n=1 Tax=Kribbella sp. NPDC050241 TaxID=3364115 RepID=UPI00379CEE18
MASNDEKPAVNWTNLFTWLAVVISFYALLQSCEGGDRDKLRLGLDYGQQCIDWQQWVLDRVQDGFTDEAITDMTMQVIVASTADHKAPTEASKPGEDYFFDACGYVIRQPLLEYVHKLRATVPRASPSAPPTSGQR